MTRVHVPLADVTGEALEVAVTADDSVADEDDDTSTE
jgi:hypothetical protein